MNNNSVVEIASPGPYALAWRRIRHHLAGICERVDAVAALFGARIVRWSQRRSPIVAYVRSEWEIAFPSTGDVDGDAMQAAMGQHLVNMVAMFSSEGHSGFSASYAISYLQKALKWEPLSPLTGSDSEWSSPFCSEGTRQNRRCGRVFLGADGRAYDIEGRVFEDDISRFTSGKSRVYITFPYTPTTKIVRVRSPKTPKEAS